MITRILRRPLRPNLSFVRFQNTNQKSESKWGNYKKKFEKFGETSFRGTVVHYTCI